MRSGGAGHGLATTIDLARRTLREAGWRTLAVKSLQELDLYRRLDLVVVRQRRAGGQPHLA